MEICEKFYEDCYAHWLRDFATNKVLQSERDETITVEEQAKAYAIRDIKAITRNPFSPSGDDLNVEGKEAFLSTLA